MRKQTQDDLRIIYNEEEMLKGNINRMCVTDNMAELKNMRYFAMRRIANIYNLNFSRLMAKEE